jgi:hypothetical protein
MGLYKYRLNVLAPVEADTKNPLVVAANPFLRNVIAWLNGSKNCGRIKENLTLAANQSIVQPQRKVKIPPSASSD